MAEQQAAPRTAAALATLERNTAFITPGEHVTSLTEEFLRQLVSAALAGKRLGLAVEEDRVLERLERAEALAAAVQRATTGPYLKSNAAWEMLTEALDAWERAKGGAR